MEIKQVSGTPRARTKEELEEAAKRAYEQAIEVEQAPEGWFTATEWGKILGVTRGTARESLKKLVAKGRAQEEKFSKRGVTTTYYGVHERKSE